MTVHAYECARELQAHSYACTARLIRGDGSVACTCALREQNRMHTTILRMRERLGRRTHERANSKRIRSAHSDGRCTRMHCDL